VLIDSDGTSLAYRKQHTDLSLRGRYIHHLVWKLCQFTRRQLCLIYSHTAVRLGEDFDAAGDLNQLLVWPLGLWGKKGWQLQRNLHELVWRSPFNPACIRQP
jgi:hypothetical protein